MPSRPTQAGPRRAERGPPRPLRPWPRTTPETSGSAGSPTANVHVPSAKKTPWNDENSASKSNSPATTVSRTNDRAPDGPCTQRTRRSRRASAGRPRPRAVIASSDRERPREEPRAGDHASDVGEMADRGRVEAGAAVDDVGKGRGSAASDERADLLGDVEHALAGQSGLLGKREALGKSAREEGLGEQGERQTHHEHGERQADQDAPDAAHASPRARRGVSASHDATATAKTPPPPGRHRPRRPPREHRLPRRAARRRSLRRWASMRLPPRR